jgi:hypothetical protein
MATLHIRPLFITRCANSFGGLALPYVTLAGSVEVFDIPYHIAEILVVPFALAALVLAVRGFRLGVVCRPETITVRGYSRSRSIPIQSVLDINDDLLLLNAIRWRDERGRVRKTPAVVLTTPVPAAPFVKEQNERSMRQLQDWIDRHRFGEKADQ